MIQIDMQMPKTCEECDFEIFNGSTDECLFVYNGYTDKIRMCKRLDACPLHEADPDTVSRPQGHWEMLQIPINPPVYKCSVCGGHALETMTGCLVNRHLEANLTNFCPNCGADMREDGEANADVES